MSITVDTIQLKFNVTPSYQQQQIQQLNAALKQATANYESLGKAAKDNAKEHSRLRAQRFRVQRFQAPLRPWPHCAHSPGFS